METIAEQTDESPSNVDVWQRTLDRLAMTLGRGEQRQRYTIVNLQSVVFSDRLTKPCDTAPL